MWSHKGYTFITISGLVISLAACLMISLWVADELSFDRFNEKGDRIYRASWEARYGNNEWNIPLCPVPLAPMMEKEFPEVESTVRFIPGGFTLRHGEQFVREQKVLFTEESFFDIFTVHVVSGDPAAALRDPDGVVLTTESARRYFPDGHAQGGTIQRNDGKLFHVGAIVESFPEQSHVHFDFLASLRQMPVVERRRSQWGSATVYTYVLLRDAAAFAALDKKLAAYVDKNIMSNEARQAGNFTRFPLIPLLDIHLQSHQKYELEPNGNITTVYLFSLIALFILLLACVNFVNLATARSVKRAREVGLRKVFGSQRTQLVRQFMAESMLTVLLSVVGGLVLTAAVLPSFNDFSGKTLSLGILGTPLSLAFLLGLSLVVALLAGAYPAFVLSSFWPAQVLKGGTFRSAKGDRMRRVLVVLQFTVSAALIIGTLIVRDQLRFVLNKDLGFDKEHVLLVHRASALGSHYNAVRNQLLAEPSVAGVSGAQFLPGQTFDSMLFTLEQPANYQTTSVTYDWVDPDFVDVLKLHVIEGRNFSRSFATDSSAFLINEAAAKAFGWDKPLGREIAVGSLLKGPVIGVVEDFHFESLHQEVKPMLFLFNRWSPSYLAVRLKAGSLESGLAAVRSAWNQSVKTTPFKYSFLDQDYGHLYDAEQRVERVFLVFAVLAVVIACLGLFGLASFTVEQRTKEIGIRKVLGASVPGVVTLLMKEFVLLVLIANAVAWPIAYWGMRGWLEGFAYRIDLGLGIFLVTMGIALTIAVATVIVQAVRAALMNPADTLKYE